jgi:hypothetical protein
MTWLGTFRLLFILYCVEAGVFLLLTPWSPRWEQSLIQLPATGLVLWLLHPAVRGAISGFGLVHLVWGAHDLDLWLAARRRPGSRDEPEEGVDESSTEAASDPLPASVGETGPLVSRKP